MRYILKVNSIKSVFWYFFLHLQLNILSHCRNLFIFIVIVVKIKLYCMKHLSALLSWASSVFNTKAWLLVTYNTTRVAPTTYQQQCLPFSYYLINEPLITVWRKWSSVLIWCALRSFGLSEPIKWSQKYSQRWLYCQWIRL